MNDGSKTFILNQQEMQELFRQDPPTAEDGEWQQMLVKLQGQCNRQTGKITLDPTDLESIPRYAFDYGNGGWESRLRGIFGSHLGFRLGRPADN